MKDSGLVATFFRGYIICLLKIGKQKQYSILYDCECDGLKVGMLKTIYASNGAHSSWRAVTDTGGVIKFFIDSVSLIYLQSPLEFVPVTQEEMDLFSESNRQVDKACCHIPETESERVIGYLRVKTQ